MTEYRIHLEEGFEFSMHVTPQLAAGYFVDESFHLS